METLCRRKEPRFKTCDEESLLCDTAVEDIEAVNGAVIDISPSGLRLLCEGNFKVGQELTTELKTDERTHGTYRGVIRRVEPWMGGNSILGCQLLDKIPEEVLESLAQEEVVNRRQDDRVDWGQSAKISWELQPGEFDVEIHDCSPGGMKVSSQTNLPDDLRLRLCIDVGEDEPVVVDAKTVWQQDENDEIVAGLAFTKKELPDAIAEVLGHDQPSQLHFRVPSIRQSIVIASTVILLGVALFRFWA